MFVEIRSQKTRSFMLQLLFVTAVVFLTAGSVITARSNLEARGLTAGFSFLFRSTGWEVNTAVMSVTGMDPYWWFFVVGLVNTMMLGITGLVLATAVGSALGIARSSGNELAALLATTYVEIFRNIPLILQVFFLHAMFTHLPGPRQALEFGGAMLSGRGVYIPVLNLNAPAAAALSAILAAGVFSALKTRGRVRWCLVTGAVCLATAALFLVIPPGEPLIDWPTLQGLNLRGGLRIAPEFMALSLAITIYGGAYIGEIVRGGFKAVGNGQIEAARALGLHSWHVFSRIQVPLALRAMLPMLANQYVWLIKATTLGVTIGFSDFFMMVAMTINHSGQTLEAIAILMSGFLLINFTIAAVFNRINRAIALKGNQLRG